jgi:hypothetical protein
MHAFPVLVEGCRVAALALLAACRAQAAEVDESMCRGAYPVLLMTSAECRMHLARVRVLEALGDRDGLAETRRQQALLLDERALVCGCAQGDDAPAQAADSGDC